MLGVVMERRAVSHAWASHSWRAISVIPGAQAVTDWRLLAERPGWAQYHAATLPLELYRTETEGYRANLSQPHPLVFVACRAAGTEGRPEPFLVTACPYEAEDYEVSDDERVDTVAMPAAMVNPDPLGIKKQVNLL